MFSSRGRRLLASRLALAVLFAVHASRAAPGGPITVKPDQVSSPIASGTWVGGRSGEEFSLLSVERSGFRNGERLLLTYGDRNGEVLKSTQPGFFHVHLTENGRKLIVDLAQVNRTTVTPQQLAKILSPSPCLSDSDMTMDPHDGSTNMTLVFKEPVRLAVMSRTKGAAQVVLELRYGQNATVQSGRPKE